MLVSLGLSFIEITGYPGVELINAPAFITGHTCIKKVLVEKIVVINLGDAENGYSPVDLEGKSLDAVLEELAFAGAG